MAEQLQPKDSLRFLSGIGPKRAESLAALGVESVEDLLAQLPGRYEDRRSIARISELREDASPVALKVRVLQARLVRTRKRGFTIFNASVEDDSGAVAVVWYNQPYLQRVVEPGRELMLYGRVTRRQNKRVLDNPVIEPIDDPERQGIHVGRIVPVYRKLGDVHPRRMRRLLFEALERTDLADITCSIPAEWFEREELIPKADAIRAVHFPPNEVSFEALQEYATPAQRTLAFEEIYLLQLALQLRKLGRSDAPEGIAFDVTPALRRRLAALLPFKLTEAQKRTLKEIGEDLRRPQPMQRLVQGDVGSGKTIVAILSLLVAVANRCQGALMVPTEILAEQHAQSLHKLFENSPNPPQICLLTGSLRAAARRDTLAAIASGEAHIVVGTHALFEQKVEFKRLGLVVVDEQHRFGVAQRAALAEKGMQPHVLAMTATPIPRSLAMTLYGDLDLSLIDERPPGRIPIKTVVRTENERDRVLKGILHEVRRGRQAYVVTPLAEESETLDLKAAAGFAEDLRQRLPTLTIDMLHGKMKPKEKQQIMQRFVAGETQVLVSTTVIEVGVDVPNATVMIIEHAERFGLSQLHQLRGRVGRGGERSFCVLMVSDDATSEDAQARLEIMEQTEDGFQIAERDLQIRGPGALLGTQQSGLSDLQFLETLLRQPRLLEAARMAASNRLSSRAGRESAWDELNSLGARWRHRLALARIG